jgi:short chain dehydrogenase
MRMDASAASGAGTLSAPEAVRTDREIVVVTGADAGVGRATALAFAGRGAHIGLLARDPGRLAAAAAEIERAGGRPLAIPTDVADAAAVDAAAEQVEQTFGPVDIWINNAMATIFGPAERIEPAEFKRATEVTYLGTVFEPEVVAAGIVFAVYAGKREVRIGVSTLQAIWGTKLVPGWLDRYLARHAYEGQMSEVPAESGAPGNLFAPAPAAVGAHGRFEREARQDSWQLRLSMWANRVVHGDMRRPSHLHGSSSGP